jgi:hypothetical protein
VTWSGNGQTDVVGPLNDTIASLAPGASVTYTLTALIDPNATGKLSNTVTVTAANDTNPDNNNATDTDELTPQNDVSIAKSDNAVTKSDNASSATATVTGVTPSMLSIGVSSALPSQATPFYQSIPLSIPGAMPLLSPVPLPTRPSVTALVGGGMGAAEEQDGLARLSGFVYLEYNNEGLRGGAETGIPNVLLTLTGTSDRGQTVTRTTVTGQDGFYSFENLPPGTYTVRETQPEDFLDGKVTVGWVNGRQTGTLSATDTIARIVLPRAGEGREYNFGELLPASISGSVYRDDNLNLEWDEDESGLSGVVVQLTGQDDRGGNVYRTVTTDEEGNYIFANLRLGNYTVTVGSKNGLVSVHAQVGTLGGLVEDTESVTGIIVSSGMHGMRYDFAKVNPGAGSPEQGGPEQGGEMREENASDDLPSVAETDAFFSLAGENPEEQFDGWDEMASLSLIATATAIAVLERRRKESSRDTTSRGRQSVCGR